MRTSHHARLSNGRRPWTRQIQLRGDAAVEISPETRVTGMRQAVRKMVQSGLFSARQHLGTASRLVIASEWLEKHLARPVRVQKLRPNVWRVVVFGCLTYTVFPDEGRIASGRRVGKGHEYFDFTFEVGKPLATPYWIRYVLEHIGLIDRSQQDLLCSDEDLKQDMRLLEVTLYRLLLREPLFRELRDKTLPRALNIPRDILWIAMASRTRQKGPMLTSYELARVWRNAAAFRQVARENPQLLPLLNAFLFWRRKDFKPEDGDPVAAIKAALRRDGLSDAAWRYLTRHGARLFKVAWSITGPQTSFGVARHYLQALEYAGLPPPPPPSVARAFLHAHAEHIRHDVRLNEGFERAIDPDVLGLSLREADIQRSSPFLPGFIEEFLAVCQWSSEIGVLMRENGTKPRWPWLAKQARLVEADQALMEVSRFEAWPTRVPEFESGPWLVKPVLNSLELFHEASAMRNCLQKYLESCQTGKTEIYSVRERDTGKRKASIGLAFSDTFAALFDVKGFANQPPDKDIERLANALLDRIRNDSSDGSKRSRREAT